jgi:tetratricopeptide (TPR) repeat protein
MDRFLHLVLLTLVTLLAACTSPEEKALEYYESGQALLESGDPVKAKLEFQNALQINEKMAPAWYGLALVAEKEADWPKMFALLNKVIELDSKHLQAQIKSGRLLLASGQLDKALEVSNVTMELAPEDADVLALRAATFYKLEDNESAIKFANAALAISPNNIDAIAVLATERLAAGDAMHALEYLDQGSGRSEGDVGLQLIKIEALNRLEKLDAVEGVYRRLIELYPDTSVFSHRLAEFYVLHERQADAEQIYRDIMLANPDDMNAKLDVVRFVNTIHGTDAAISEMKKFIKAEPGNMELLFALSQLYQSADQKEMAAQSLELVIAQGQSSDDRLRAMGLLAVLKLEKGQKPEAMALVEEILVQDPRDEQALIIKATQLIDDRKLDEAISNLRTILKDSPNSARALLLLGNAHELSGSTELADDVFARAFQASGQSPDFGAPYAAFLLRAQRAQRASEVLQDALRTQPNHVAALTLLAQIRIGRGDWAGAQRIADRIAALEDADGVSQQILGAVFAGRKEYEQSIELFKQAYQATPSESRPMLSLVQAYLRAGKEDEAMGFLQSVLSVSDSNNDARLLMGQLYAMQNENEKAFGVFREVIKRDPTNVMAYSNLASLNLRVDKKEEAIKVLEAGLAKVPGDLSLRLMKADIYELQKNYDAAIGVYEELLKEHPNADVVANNLASLLTDYREDEASLKRAHELALRFRSSNIAHFQDTLGWTYFRMGKAEEANELIKDANKNMPDVPVFRYHLGMTYMALDEQESARSEFEKALELAGDDPFPFREDVEQAIKDL